ncbi:hypothetical protein OESDEN_00611 [Oesophagostomum dentatum]|uniref:Uncharacterized protein n=1 Tax=Oesophagostomum dentatum TaxID=61180 RepID=A0A0B1TP83_OESDE|nr:hypothetical protein OESDEN_00611 [Oesophagostomum dentatum]
MPGRAGNSWSILVRAPEDHTQRRMCANHTLSIHADIMKDSRITVNADPGKRRRYANTSAKRVIKPTMETIKLWGKALDICPMMRKLYKKK